MDSTFRGDIPPCLGADLTDRYSKGCRRVEVCGLMPSEDDKLMASFSPGQNQNESPQRRRERGEETYNWFGANPDAKNKRP